MVDKACRFLGALVLCYINNVPAQFGHTISSSSAAWSTTRFGTAETSPLEAAAAWRAAPTLPHTFSKGVGKTSCTQVAAAACLCVSVKRLKRSSCARAHLN